MQCQSDLMKVVLATGAVGGFPHLLDGREQKSHQDGDDGDHDQQFNQRKRVSANTVASSHGPSLLLYAAAIGQTSEKALLSTSFSDSLSRDHPNGSSRVMIALSTWLSLGAWSRRGRGDGAQVEGFSPFNISYKII